MSSAFSPKTLSLISRTMKNQSMALEVMKDIDIPPPRRISDKVECEFCDHYRFINKSARSCEVWNRRYPKNFHCEFHKPTMISGESQFMINVIKKCYPRSIATEFVKVVPLGTL